MIILLLEINPEIFFLIANESNQLLLSDFRNATIVKYHLNLPLGISRIIHLFMVELTHSRCHPNGFE